MNASTSETTVLFVQGAGEGAHDEDRLLANALGQELGERLRVVFPRLPGEADPDKEAWQRAIAEQARRAGAAAVVAHSAGAAITADLLAEGRYGKELPCLRAVFLLAPPFMGPGGWDFEGFHFDHAVSRQALDGLALHLYFGLADATVPPSHADLYRHVFPEAIFRSLPGCDHQFSGHLSTVAGDLRALILGDARRNEESPMKRSTSLAAALCFILGAAFSTASHAAPGPRFVVPDRTPTTGVLPQRLATADFNQDGHNDVAVANLGPDAFVGGVDVLLGDGKGRLGDPIRTPLGAQTGAYQVAAGDFNGDGKPDLAALTGTTGGYGPIAILLGRGDGSFDPGPSSLPAGEGNIAVADLTGDGKADIVFVFTRSAQLKLFKGKGDGSFAAPILFDRDFGAYDIELADVNGDGRLDIVGAAGGPIWSMLNLGGGDFGPQVFQASPDLSGFKLALADFNGDGKADVAAVNASGGAVQIGLGTGTGAFAPFQVYEDVSFATTWIAAADWTGDGRPDLVVNNEYAGESNTVVLMKGQGDGSFGGFSYWVTGNDDPTPVQLDGDGLTDLLAFSSDAGRVYATLNAGNGRFKAPRSQPVKGVGTASKADVDGDGHLDLVMMGVVLPQAGELAVEVFTYLNDGKGHFKKAVVSPTMNVEAGDGIGEIVLADVNEDGQLDVVAGFVHLFPKAGNVWVLLGDGTGRFGKLAVYSTGEVHASNDSIAVADVTGDGHLDIVGHTLSQLAVLPGDGQGHFGAPIASGDSTSSQVKLLIADFTLDGIPDAVAVIRTGGPDFGKGDLRLQKGLGDGRFQLIQTLSYDGNPNDAVLADLNGDGRPDVGVSATRGSNGGRSGLRVSLDQDGQLGPIAFYPTPPFPGGPIEAADFDLDGDIDIAGGAAGAIAIALNDGQGVFTGPFAMISATSGERIAGDFTGDGKPDLVTVNVTNRAQLALFVNSTRR